MSVDGYERFTAKVEGLDVPDERETAVGNFVVYGAGPTGLPNASLDEIEEWLTTD